MALFMNSTCLSRTSMHRSAGRLALFLRLLIACTALSQMAYAITPPPDGGYPNFNTAEGQNALFNIETNNPLTGLGNTATGWYALFSNENGNYCSAVGAGALALNRADDNTAIGALALMLNDLGVLNTAVGANAMVYNYIGSWNTAVGV